MLSGPYFSLISFQRVAARWSASSHEESSKASALRTMGLINRLGLVTNSWTVQPFTHSLPRFTGLVLEGRVPTIFPSRTSKSNICRSGTFTQATVNATTHHMDGPSQMESRIGRRNLPSPHQLILFKGAFIAKTHRTDISAPETLDASVKLRLPELESSIQIHFLDAGDF